MMRIALAAVLVAACGDNLEIETEEPGGEPIVAVCRESEVPALLSALPGVVDATESPCNGFVNGNARCFLVRFTQPVNHAAPAATFEQRLYLVHRGCERPTVVADWGYDNQYFFDDELSVLFSANSLWIEHRYQGESVPAEADWDWTQLTIENGANDMHAVIAAFKRVYGDRWVSTGASKGGITAAYHAYFFHDDVDGVVPYVAPASRARVDANYQTYMSREMRGDCADRVRAAQVDALTSRRAMMVGRLADFVGGFEDEYLESMTTHLDWGFWQGSGVDACDGVPGADASDDAFWNFYSEFSGFGPQVAPAPGDDEKSYGALTYEWLTEQGFALQIGEHIRPLLVHEWATQTMEDTFRASFPDVELPAYDGSVTRSTRRWAELFAENMVLIYGELDPWSGGALEVPQQPTSARYFVPEANHGASVLALPEADRDAALAHLERMFGRPSLLSAAPMARQAARTRDAMVRSALLRHDLRRHLLR